MADPDTCLSRPETYHALIDAGYNKFQALQTAALCPDLDVATTVLREVYHQPVGASRLEASRVETRRPTRLTREVQGVIDALSEFSAPGTTFDFDGRVDPAQLVHFEVEGGTRTVAQVAEELTAGLCQPAEQLCALFDFVRGEVTYTRNKTQYNVGNYWASAGETLASCKGDCACQAIAFASLAEACGFVTRLVCIPDHAFAHVLIDPTTFNLAALARWVQTKPNPRGGGAPRRLSTGVNYYVANGRHWLMCDLTMSTYAGARSSQMVMLSPHRWGFPQEWMQEVGGKSVTYRYASNEGTRFEWAVSSTVDGDAATAIGVTFVPDKNEELPPCVTPLSAESAFELLFAEASAFEESQSEPSEPITGPGEYRVNMRSVSSGGSPTVYMAHLSLSAEGVVSGHVDVKGQEVPISGEWSLENNALQWHEHHKQCGTYGNDYINETNLQGEGSYHSVNNKYKGSVTWRVVPDQDAAADVELSAKLRQLTSCRWLPGSYALDVRRTGAAESAYSVHLEVRDATRVQDAPSDECMHPVVGSVSMDASSGSPSGDLGNDVSIEAGQAHGDSLSWTEVHSADDAHVNCTLVISGAKLSGTCTAGDGASGSLAASIQRSGDGFHPGTLARTVTTTSTTGKENSYQITFSLELPAKVTGTAVVGDKKVRVEGSWGPGHIKWTEFHKEAGTYQNNYHYSVPFGDDGKYRSGNGRYTGACFLWD